MSEINISRRNFMQLMGAGAAVLAAGSAAPRVIARTADGVLVQSEEEYGRIVVEKLDKGKFPYEYDPDTIRPFSEKNTVFSRNVWAPDRQDRPETKENLTTINLVENKGLLPDQTRLDYALMQAAWHYSGAGSPYGWQSSRSSRMFLGMGRWDPADLDMTWEDATRAVKHASLFYGASLAGVAELNPLWMYPDHFAPRRGDRERTIPLVCDGERFEKTDETWYVPRSLDRVIALAFEEDYSAIANSPGRLASAATGNGYSRMAVTATTLAEFIRMLGYRALPAGNGIGLSIPMAIDAGLGELGRMGLLLTPKYGPRVRLAKVITDMPLVPDAPISFGVKEFCESCMLCAEECPSGAVTSGPRTWKGKSPVNSPGAFKWYAEQEKCYDFNGFSCSNCKRVCPFNKPNNSWLHKLTRDFIKSRAKALDKIMVRFDQASGYGRQVPASEFWKSDGSGSITSREKM
jgi:epoxyqueuosine reductase